MICGLAKGGQTIGVTANSHTVIGKLLDEAIVAAGKDGHAVRCVQKLTELQTRLMIDDRPGALSLDIFFVDERGVYQRSQRHRIQR